MMKNLILILLLLVCASVYAGTIEPSLSSNKIALGETFTVSFTVTNGSRKTPDFSVLQEDFTIISTNYGNSINIVNGVMKSQLYWQLTLAPKRAGELTIPEINFGKDSSLPQTLKVIANSSDITNSDETTPIFTDAEISQTSPYVQSQVTYKVKLYYQTQLENLRIEAPHIKDATLVQIDQGKIYQTTVKGRPFAVAEKNFAIFPQKPGKISIPSARFHAVALDTNSMMGGPFYFAAPKPVSLATKEFTLNVRNAPPAFTGSPFLPAKNITLSEQWSVEANDWQAGNPVTRTITVQAEGLRADQIPDITIDKIRGVNTYVDPPQRSNNVQGDAVFGMLEQKVTYIPDTAQTADIPALQLHWWNTETNTNAIAELKSLSIHINGKIKAVDNSAKNVSIPLNDVKTPTLKEENKASLTSFYTSIWFWVALGLLLMWIITIGFLWYKLSPKKAPKKVPDAISLDDKSFKAACRDGNALIAQQFLLSWSKKKWQDIPLNLEKLRALVNDESFQQELSNLERAIYAKHSHPWRGEGLWHAFQKINRNKNPRLKNKKNEVLPDPLPPLNP